MHRRREVRYRRRLSQKKISSDEEGRYIILRVKIKLEKYRHPSDWDGSDFCDDRNNMSERKEGQTHRSKTKNHHRVYRIGMDSDSDGFFGGPSAA